MKQEAVHVWATVQRHPLLAVQTSIVVAAQLLSHHCLSLFHIHLVSALQGLMAVYIERQLSMQTPDDHIHMALELHTSRFPVWEQLVPHTPLMVSYRQATSALQESMS